MFDIGWGELLVIGIVALIAIGPKELPGVLRTVGHWMGKVRRMAAEFQSQFQEAMREAEMADIKKEVDKIGEAASDFNFETFEKPIKDLERSIEDKPAAVSHPALAEAAPQSSNSVTTETAQTAASDAGAPAAEKDLVEPRGAKTEAGGRAA